MFLLVIVVLLILGYLWPYFTGKTINDANNGKDVSKNEFGIVTRVVDGDTIHVNISGKDEIVRMLGINTPEKKKPYYQEAKNFLVDMVENKSVELLIDKEDVDRYERKLRYVFYEDMFVNVEIVQAGFATTFMLDELKYRDKFVNAEKFARTNGVGLWKQSYDKCGGCIKLVKLDPIVDYFIIKNECDFNCNLSGWIVKDDANHFFYINSLNGFEEMKYDSLIIFKKEVWNDIGDRFFMRDEMGNLVLFYEY